MKTKNALEILQKHTDRNPNRKAAYDKEKEIYNLSLEIKKHRKKLNLTQKELAQLANTTQSVISRIENPEYGGHSLSLLKRICNVLNVKIEGLLKENKKNELVNDKIIKFKISPVVSKVHLLNNCNSNNVMKNYAK